MAGLKAHSKTWVMTAAHCAHDSKGKQAVNVTVRFNGKEFKGSIPSQPPDVKLERSQLRYHQHPEYNDDDILNDIALIELGDVLEVPPFSKLGENAAQVALAPPQSSTGSSKWTNVYGRGSTGKSSRSRRRLAVNKGRGKQVKLSSSELCARGDGGISLACLDGQLDCEYYSSKDELSNIIDVGEEHSKRPVQAAWASIESGGNGIEFDDKKEVLAKGWQKGGWTGNIVRPCSGDSGGPSVRLWQCGSEVVQQQVGVVSWSPSKCVEGDQSPYSVYTHVNQYLSWICSTSSLAAACDASSPYQGLGDCTDVTLSGIAEVGSAPLVRDVFSFSGCVCADESGIFLFGRAGRQGGSCHCRRVEEGR